MKQWRAWLKWPVALWAVILSHILLYATTLLFAHAPQVSQLVTPASPGHVRLILPVEFIFLPAAQEEFILKTRGEHPVEVSARYLAAENGSGQRHILEMRPDELLRLNTPAAHAQLLATEAWLGVPKIKHPVPQQSFHPAVSPQRSYEEIIF